MHHRPPKKKLHKMNTKIERKKIWKKNKEIKRKYF